MRKSSTALVAIASLLGALYLAQSVTHLRLDNDAVWYLRITMALSDRTPVPHLGVPIGYSVILAAFDRVSLLSSASIVLTNCLGIAAGIAAVWTIQDSETREVRIATVIFTLLSFPIVRSVAMPLPDAMYFGLSLMAIATMQKLASREGISPGYVILALLLTGLAFAVRLVAITLLPSLVWCIARPMAKALGKKRMSWVVATLFAVALVAMAAIIALRVRDGTAFRYIADAQRRYGNRTLLEAAGERVGSSFRRIGELAINLPRLKFPKLDIVLAWIGAIPSLILLAGAWKRRRVNPVTIYVGAYLLIMVVWPFDAVRLWMPIVPFLIWLATKLALASTQSHPAKGVLVAYVALFAVTGLAALAYTTRISMAGDNFPFVYGDRGGLSTPGLEVTNREHDYFAAKILKRYDPRQPDLAASRWDTVGTSK